MRCESSLVFGQTTPFLGSYFLVPHVGGWLSDLLAHIKHLMALSFMSTKMKGQRKVNQCKQ